MSILLAFKGSVSSPFKLGPFFFDVTNNVFLSQPESASNDVYPALIDGDEMVVIDAANESAGFWGIQSGDRTAAALLASVLASLSWMNFQSATSAETASGPVLALPAANGGGFGLIDLSTSAPLSLPAGAPTTSSACYFSPDGSKLAVLSSVAAKRLSVYNTTTWATLTQQAVNGAPRGGAWSPDGSRFAIAQNVANGPNAVAIFESTSWTRSSAPALLTGVASPSAHRFAYSPDGSLLVILQGDTTLGNHLRVYDTTTWTVVAGPLSLSYSAQTEDGIVFSPDGAKLFAYKDVFDTSSWSNITAEVFGGLSLTAAIAHRLFDYTPSISEPFWTNFRNARETITPE